jgi:hypothetical protein
MLHKDITHDLRNFLTEDKDLYYAYQCNIAMCFKDEIKRYKNQTNNKILSDEDFHIISNQAAINFLDLFINMTPLERRNFKIKNILSEK